MTIDGKDVEPPNRALQIFVKSREFQKSEPPGLLYMALDLCLSMVLFYVITYISNKPANSRKLEKVLSFLKVLASSILSIYMWFDKIRKKLSRTCYNFLELY